ncbi:unnamed protein product [Lactuca virosa]|uniref:Uncharacterized protein n=1 Tax=Lactuca virosa TaxID=75947 RepID=A0AAU9M0Q8_9ASTR|nr:unnamed protein product [Lactuca virosa]
MATSKARSTIFGQQRDKRTSSGYRCRLSLLPLLLVSPVKLRQVFSNPVSFDFTKRLAKWCLEFLSIQTLKITLEKRNDDGDGSTSGL